MADDDRREGVVFLAETAPSGAKAVVVSWEGREQIIPVRDGLVLFTAWGVPYANASADSRDASNSLLARSWSGPVGSTRTISTTE